MARVVMELGEFDMKDMAGRVRGRVRQISIAATTETELEDAVEVARCRGWAPVELMRGIDVTTGWPSLWMSKQVEGGEPKPG